MPASTALIASYLSHLAEERRLSVATTRLHKAALAAVHKAAGHGTPPTTRGVKRVMQGTRPEAGQTGWPGLQATEAL